MTAQITTMGGRPISEEDIPHYCELWADGDNMTRFSELGKGQLWQRMAEASEKRLPRITLHPFVVTPELFEILAGMALAERYIGASESLGVVTFAPDQIAAKVSCHECGGTGWWGYGPVPETCGPCVNCKGTGLVWVGL